MEKTLLEISFRAILIHLLNQIFHLKKNQSDFCLCEYWLYRRYKSKTIQDSPLLYHSKGYCSNCQLIEELSKLNFWSELYKLFSSRKVGQLYKIKEKVKLVQDKLDSLVGGNIGNENLFKNNVYIIDLVFPFNEESFISFSFGLWFEEYILHLKTLKERNEDGTKKFSGTFYFSNFWFALLYWQDEYSSFDKVINKVIENDEYDRNFLYLD